MTPRTNFPGAGPDQTLFFMLFGIGFVLGVVGYLLNSKTIRLAGILTVFVATSIFIADVLETSR